MRGVLQDGDVVIDAGAYKGGYTFTMRDCVGDHGRVFAFEPQPELAAFLRRGVAAYGWDNVHIEEAGLSDRPGEGTLHTALNEPAQTASVLPENADSDARVYPIRLESIDAFVERTELCHAVSFIKVDVEGNELATFRGAERLLRRDRPRLLFECEGRHLPAGSVRDVFQFVQSLGYRGFFFDGGDRVDVTEFDESTHQVEGQHPYVNLFAFEPAPEGT